MPAAEVQRLPAHACREFIARALATAGLPANDASEVAHLMTLADLRGADGHGIFRLAQYVRRIRAGGLNLSPQIRFRTLDGWQNMAVALTAPLAQPGRAA